MKDSINKLEKAYMSSQNKYSTLNRWKKNINQMKFHQDLHKRILDQHKNASKKKNYTYK